MIECCERMEMKLDSSDETGILLVKNEGVYFIKSRAISIENEQKLLEILVAAKINFNVNVSNEFAIGYCPWCGKKLD